jgi:hypothetical protein
MLDGGMDGWVDRMGKTTRVSAGLERIMGGKTSFFWGLSTFPLFWFTAQEAFSFSFLLVLCLLEL